MLKLRLLFLMLVCLTTPCATAVEPPLARAQSKQGWIWGPFGEELDRPAHEVCYFRRLLEVKGQVESAVFFVTCDNQFQLFMNGKQVARGSNWSRRSRVDLKKHLQPGRNVIAIRGKNDGGPAALIVDGAIVFADKSREEVHSNGTFLTSATESAGWNTLNFDDSSWKPARVLFKDGDGPWGSIPSTQPAPTPPRFETLPGFTVTSLGEAPGSLIALALDDSGGAYVSTEGGGIYYYAPGSQEPAHVTDTLQNAQGLRVTKDGLHVVGIGPSGLGLYHWKKPDEVELLGLFAGDGGEHGAHGIVIGPDNHLYIAVGNHVAYAGTPDPSSPFRNRYEGSAIPFFTDPLGHAAHVKAPGGTVMQVDPTTKTWRTFAGGFRNHYDLAFDEHGNLFTYDSDMEWDVGLPWYRPVRLLHVIAGGEYGWRTGSGKWPEHYEDSLPGVASVGRGSPTGIAYYQSGTFPAAFHRSILACDWSRGEILAFALTPSESTFTATHRTLLRGHPLNVTDIEVAHDGSVVFTTGGRGTQGGIHRLQFTGGAPAPAVEPARPVADQSPAPDAAVPAWMDPRRFVRFAAQRALAARPVNEWLPGILKLKNPAATAAAMIAAAGRAADDPQTPDDFLLLTAANEMEGVLKATSDPTAALSLLRAVELLLSTPARNEVVRRQAATVLTGVLTAAVPSAQPREAVLMGRILAAVDAPEAVPVLLARLRSESSRALQIEWMYCLRVFTRGWTPESREQAAAWFTQAFKWNGGMSYKGYIAYIWEDFRIHAQISPELVKKTLEASQQAEPPAPAVSGATSSPKDLDAVALLASRTAAAPHRSPAAGALIYQSLCARCHSCGSVPGKNLGPELTDARGRFSTMDLLDATINPSRVVSDQYRALEITVKNGPPVTGLRSVETDQTLTLALADGSQAVIPKDNILERRQSPVSLMPEGLLDSLTLEQTCDLLAFIESKGAPAPPANDGWTVLFDGRSLDAFDVDPKLWKLESTVIHGKGTGLPGSRFLVAKEQVKDFVIEYDIKIAGNGNSGMQFRSVRAADHPNVKVDDPAHVLLGYQADAGQEYWGFLYEEGGRGILATVANEIRASIIDPDGWNHYVVSAVGDRIRIEVNGYTTVELADSQFASGYLGWQLHAGDTEIWLRNIRVKKL